jgi:CCR4-NOT transcriptional regulation complex NOT5 subunit
MLFHGLIVDTQEPDFEEDEYIYDDLNLEEEERIYSIPNAEDVANPPPEEDGIIWFSTFLSAFSNF